MLNFRIKIKHTLIVSNKKEVFFQSEIWKKYNNFKTIFRVTFSFLIFDSFILLHFDFFSFRNCELRLTKPCIFFSLLFTILCNLSTWTHTKISDGKSRPVRKVFFLFPVKTWYFQGLKRHLMFLMIQQMKQSISLELFFSFTLSIQMKRLFKIASSFFINLKKRRENMEWFHSLFQTLDSYQAYKRVWINR